jgi:16S rRNA C1402 N4-methylase RsmH
MSAPQLRQIGLRINPATRTFQALRIFLNQELEQLGTLLTTPPSCWQSAAASP